MYLRYIKYWKVVNYCELDSGDVDFLFVRDVEMCLRVVRRGLKVVPMESINSGDAEISFIILVVFLFQQQ